MVSTRSGRKDPASVELGQNGKEVKKIPTSKSKSRAIQHNADVITASESVHTKKETRGRKRKVTSIVPEQPDEQDVSLRGKKKRTTEALDSTVSIESANTRPNNDRSTPSSEWTSSKVPKDTSTPKTNMPIMSIISHKVGKKNPTSTRQDSPSSISGLSDGDMGDEPELSTVSSNSDNIKINKRIMSRDTEEVIRMFKKFDDEVLTNPVARARLLSLKFETRKRYITTFKHYIRFCCKKKLDNFFVTGPLMKEFYEEQFAISASSNPIIRLKKMDPAFSKLQEINFLVYHLENKDIPDRHIAYDYLFFIETGKYPWYHKPIVNTSSEPVDFSNTANKKSNKSLATRVSKGATEKSSGTQPSTNTNSEKEEIASSQQTNKETSQLIPTPTTRRKRTIRKVELEAFIKSQLKQTRSEIHNLNTAHIEALKLITSDQQVLNQVRSLNRNINIALDNFSSLIEKGPNEVIYSGAEKDNTVLPKSTHPVIIDMNHNIFTVYEILEEWYRIDPSVEKRIKNWGMNWIRDDIDRETYNERNSIVDFVKRISKEINEPDLFLIANDCDRYIHDKSILDEFISEIELDFDDLFKRVLRHRQRRS
ncbi:zonadhesin-like protein [Scheffersomyces stipitis CBS 6054]|uniref:Zonadhesin-like protein n=1 Tax=Scheffersomyces stipitis (strain ATCC 58785 / CBS 6054 / NBRC 10063 / NRRL Y-11545) TaxID=322104 RepID=A3LYN1_PICST|nr:zonadhesin-like protein [Scheffersomyces stipitis CBS 6054]ABN68002.2 zonadhesin-like protein [Scheffersomyces stipitis CBS 6054]KAG2731385.1 hypothetical protein G9P44_005801 [Scheffersomyces stipitis]